MPTSPQPLRRLAFDQIKAAINLALANTCIPGDNLRLSSLLESAVLVGVDRYVLPSDRREA